MMDLGILTTSFESHPELWKPIYKRIQSIKKMSPDATILITGESGVGKELVMRLCHNILKGDLLPDPLAVNCGGSPNTLVGSSLFGWEKGSFSSSIENKKGLFEAVGRGTLFLDEFTSISTENQSAFLRILEQREFFKIGQNSPLDFVGNLIIATNRDVCDEKIFRFDLLHRLTRHHIEIPPLRERRVEIWPLFKVFVLEILNSQKVSEEEKASFLQLCDDSDMLYLHLERHPFRGNVRELKNLAYKIVESYFIADEITKDFVDSVMMEHNKRRRKPEREVHLRGGFAKTLQVFRNQNLLNEKYIQDYYGIF